LKAHHDPQTIRQCDSYFDHTRSALNHSCDRIGEVVNRHLKVFHIETVVNNAMFDPKMAFFTKNEDHYSALDRISFRTAQYGLSKLPRPAKRKILFEVPAAYQMIAEHAGATNETHDKTVEYS